MNARAGAFALLAVLAGCASLPQKGAERRTVTVEGWAAEVAGDEAGVRARALADAQKRAVETATGVRVAASTTVDEAITVRQRIWSGSRGRLESWKILGERAEGGLRVLQLRAVVVLEPDGAPAPPPGGATVRVAVSGPAEAGIRRGFGAGGFRLVDKNPDFVVTAKVTSRLLHDARLAPFVTSRARVSVAVEDAATGAIVWEQARESAGLDADPLIAAEAAGDAAGERAGSDAAAGLSDILWKR